MYFSPHIDIFVTPRKASQRARRLAKCDLKARSLIWERKELVTRYSEVVINGALFHTRGVLKIICMCVSGASA